MLAILPTLTMLAALGGESAPGVSSKAHDMSKFQPDGWHTVTPRIIARDPENLITFIKQVFNGRGEFRPGLPAEIRIGDSVVMISDGGGLREPAPAFLYVYVEDADTTYSYRPIGVLVHTHATSSSSPRSTSTNITGGDGDGFPTRG